MEQGNVSPLKPKYRFSHRDILENRYYWYGVVPIDSRHSEISCDATWFWVTAEKGE